jgi:hypothetical protein
LNAKLQMCMGVQTTMRTAMHRVKANELAGD